jgi:predicted amidohydrolase
MRIDLLAVQPYMTREDYLDPERFQAHMASLGAAARAMRRGDHALVVFPEDLATFLALADAPAAVRDAESLDSAFQIIGRERMPALLAAMLRHRTLSLRTAFFLTAAPTVWTPWHHTFSRLARELEAVVVAGSALVPENRLGPDSPVFLPKDHRVYNLALTFGPDGRALAVTRKHNLVPTQEDRLGLARGPAHAPTFPVGPVTAATAICYDAFSVPHSHREPGFTSLVPGLAAAGAQIIAQPSANPWWWNEPWVFPRPEPLTRRQQWALEGLKAAMEAEPRIVAGVNPQLLAQIFDVHFDGQSAIYGRRGDTVELLAEAPSGSLEPTSETVIGWVLEVPD